ncbi:relaxase/mobilization nuclease domain-containing protein, partial [Actinotalea sp. C106]|uniref:relaxase/mobilization nuclease domain-containing protein n=1 Tax=Actinotalea sp. C106 TaxID=2908644 RepID=UPI002027B940
MPNVVRGDRMAGLMSYLVGPGRANEHTEPHLVAGDTALMVWHDDAELGRDSAAGIARHLDRPRVAHDVQVTGGHVWHCSLSLRAEEGQLSDERWAAIANDFVSAMDFDDAQGTKAPCRWVAVRHGVSTNGNDHIHLVVNLVREDGTKASAHHDYRRAQTAARALEVKHDLEVLESVRAERATRGYDPGEREAQARARARAKHERTALAGGPGWTSLSAQDRRAAVTAELGADQPRHVLAVKVRGCAVSSADEAEFVRRMRRSGLLVRARFADGRTDVVTGYSVAQRPIAGERPIWYGGGHLGRDLTLPRLRDGWPDTPTGASAAAREWTAAKRGRRVVAPGREMLSPEPGEWARQNEELGALVERLRAVPVEDRDTWATVARQTAGAFAAWSNATEQTPGDLAAAAEALSRSAQTYTRTATPQKAGTVAISGAAMLLASASRGGQGSAAQAAMIRQLLRLTQAVHAAAAAGQQARQAQLLAQDTRAPLSRI